MLQILQNIKAFVLTKYFIKQLGLILLFYVSIVFLMMLYLRFSTNHGEKLEVPNLIGKNAEEAKIILEDLGLAYQILDSVYDPSKKEGTIISQNPQSTTRSLLFVKSGRTIALRVTKKTDLVEMPSLIHKQLKFAENILQSRGLKCVVRYQPTDEANGSVLEQLFKGKRIKVGTRIPVGGTIVLIVGENDEGEPIAIPDLFGLSMGEAKYILDTLGFSYSLICSDCITREDSIASKVIIQSPEFLEGQTIPKSTPFTIQLRKDFSAYIENENQ